MRLPQQAGYTLREQLPSNQANDSVSATAHSERHYLANLMQGQVFDEVFGMQVPSLQSGTPQCRIFQEDACAASPSFFEGGKATLCANLDSGIMTRGLYIVLQRHFDRAVSIVHDLKLAAAARVQCHNCAGSRTFNTSTLSVASRENLRSMLFSLLQLHAQALRGSQAAILAGVHDALESAWSVTLALNVTFLALSLALHSIVHIPHTKRMQGVLDGALSLLLVVPAELATKSRAFRQGLQSAAAKTKPAK